MTNKKICITTADKEEAYNLAKTLQELLDPPPDALSVFEVPTGGWTIEAYFQEPPQEHDLRKTLETLTGLTVPQIQLVEVPALNWVALSQASLPPVYAGSFVVYGSHDSARIPRGPRSLLIEAGEAFGTAHHATTYSCLLAIDRLTRRQSFQTILDLGCGSGILAIAASRRLPQAQIIASDIDPTTIKVARENIKRNTFARRIETVVAQGVQHARIRQVKPFDLICANLLAEPLIKLARDLRNIQRSGGMLVLSGILIPQSDSVRAAYVSVGYKLIKHMRYTGWSTLLFECRTS
ncbi:MAG: 50S ribosomal protein L11 methyltransferase [Hyphomicrobium sp.]